MHAAVFAPAAGLSEAQVAATVHGRADDPAWSPRDALLVRLADELHDAAGISDELWELLAAQWSEPQLLELAALAGFYHLVAFVVGSARVPLEDGVPRFADL